MGKLRNGQICGETAKSRGKTGQKKDSKYIKCPTRINISVSFRFVDQCRKNQRTLEDKKKGLKMVGRNGVHKAVAIKLK